MKTYITQEALHAEINDIHIVHAYCLFWRIRCLAHRLLSFGWEESVRHLLPMEALILAAIVPPVMHDELVRAAYQIADARWKAFIEKQTPHLVAEAVTV